MLNRRTKNTTTSRGAGRTLLAGLVASTLLLSACGGGDEGSGEGSSGTPSAGALPIKLRVTGPTFTDLPTVTILAQDYFTKVGLDADFDFVTASNAATATQGLIAGEMDVTTAGSGALYNAYASGMTDLVSLGTTNPAMTFGLAVNNDTAKELAAKGVTPDSPTEQKVQALKGTALASSPEGSTGQKYLKTMLSAYGVDPAKDVTLVPNADNAAQLAAARQGRVNGFANSFPNTNLPEADGWGVLWLNFSEELPQILPLAAHDIYTSRKWLEENPEAAKRLLQAYWLALADLQNPTPELKEKVKNLEGFKDLNPEGFDLGWDLSIPVYKDHTPVTTEEMFQNQVELVNFERKEAPVSFKMADLYDLKAAEESKP
jgi:NitT/TauT family transport system substrate-binding protein